MGNRDRFGEDYRFIIDGLIRRRTAIGLTQTDLASLTGYDQSQISKFERSERRLDILDYARLCKAHDLDPGELLKQFPAKRSAG